MTIEVSRVPDELLIDINHGLPAVIYAGSKAGRFMGIGGLMWTPETMTMPRRCWLCLEHVDPAMCAHPLLVVRWAKRMLRTARQFGETVVYAKIDRRFSSAEKLLKIVGFRFVAMEVVGDVTVEVWGDGV